MLKGPALMGLDQGSYEKLRKLYNGLDIPGAQITPADEMDLATLCEHQFCK